VEEVTPQGFRILYEGPLSSGLILALSSEGYPLVDSGSGATKLGLTNGVVAPLWTVSFPAGPWTSMRDGNFAQLRADGIHIVSGASGAYVRHIPLEGLEGERLKLLRETPQGRFILVTERKHPWAHYEGRIIVRSTGIRGGIAWVKELGGNGVNAPKHLNVGSNSFDLAADVTAGLDMPATFGTKGAGLFRYNFEGDLIDQFIQPVGFLEEIHSIRPAGTNIVMTASYRAILLSPDLEKLGMLVFDTGSTHGVLPLDDGGLRAYRQTVKELRPDGSILELGFALHPAAGTFGDGLDFVDGVEGLDGFPKVFDATKDYAVRSRTNQIGKPYYLVYDSTGAHLLATNKYVGETNVISISLHSSISESLIFYTLDGSQPKPSSQRYTGWLSLQSNAVLRAVAYSEDLTTSIQGDPVELRITPKLPEYRFDLIPNYGGKVQVTNYYGPANFYSNTVFRLEAVPSPGSQFVRWGGDAYGTNPIITVVLDRPKVVWPAFAAPIRTFVEGSGEIIIEGAPGPYYYGPVRVYALPAPGHAFESWGGDLTGAQNPGSLQHYRTNDLVWASFVPLPPNQVTLTAMAFGQGDVAVLPHKPTYAVGEKVKVIARPRPGAFFLGWSGDASGHSAEMEVTLQTSKSLKATFAAWTGVGFMMDVALEPGIWEVLASTNLQSWQPVSRTTNTIGVVHFEDATSPAEQKRFYRFERAGP